MYRVHESGLFEENDLLECNVCLEKQRTPGFPCLGFRVETSQRGIPHPRSAPPDPGPARARGRGGSSGTGRRRRPRRSARCGGRRRALDTAPNSPRAPTAASSLSIRMDEIHVAPPKKPRNPGMIRFPPVNTNEQWFPMVSK